MITPDKPNKKCPHCLQTYEYKENPEFDPAYLIGQPGGFFHQTLFWKRVKKGHEECDRILEEQKQEEIQKEKSRVAAEKRKKLFRASNIPEHILKTKTFESFKVNEENRRAFSILDGWQITDKWGVMLQGTPGTGKSHLLIALANRWMAQFYDAFFLNVSDMFDDLKAGYGNNTYQDKMNTLKNVKILILDDIGSEKPGDWVEEKFFQLLNHRMNHGFPTFFSSNCTIAELKNRLHERITSRIKEMATVVIVKGSDMRNVVYENRLADIEERLQEEVMRV